MKKKENKKIKKNKENKDKQQKLKKLKIDISDLIDEMAYINENENILKSKKFLDNMYILDEE
ncbi:hypothetical protein [Chryseobacterium terrae]|uniref:Uncharacterized protein n=1 Tax=Chryseobacterium terrae TaxID=3163299 RepID=A0ABW8Y2H8_9FLAO